MSHEKSDFSKFSRTIKRASKSDSSFLSSNNPTAWTSHCPPSTGPALSNTPKPYNLPVRNKTGRTNSRTWKFSGSDSNPIEHCCVYIYIDVHTYVKQQHETLLCFMFTYLSICFLQCSMSNFEGKAQSTWPIVGAQLRLLKEIT